MKPIDSNELRRAFGSYMTGVTVVTTADAELTPIGFTANSFTSVSLDPPLLSVCPAKSLSSFESFSEGEYFAVNVLGEAQRDVSNTFASKIDDRFAQVAWHRSEQGVPLIDGAIARFICRRVNSIDAGDHVILLGEIISFDHDGGAGLGYCNTGYFSLGLEREAEQTQHHGYAPRVGVLVEQDRQLLIRHTDQGWEPPHVAVDEGLRPREAAEQCVTTLGVDAVLGPVYSAFHHGPRRMHFTYYRAVTEALSTQDDCHWIAVEELPNLNYTDSAHATMLRRYSTERKSGVFGVYIGDEHVGDIHENNAN